MNRLGAFEYYFRPKVDRRASGISLNVAVCPPNETHPVHEHTTPGNVVVLRGEYIEEFHGREVMITPLTARFRPSNGVHSHRTEPAGVVALHLEFTDEWLQESGCDARERSKFSVVNADGVAGGTLRTLLSIACAEGDEWTDEGTALVERTLYSASPDARVPGWLKKAKEFIDERYREELRLKTIAREVGISTMHLASTFRHHFGCSITEYATRRRLEYAATLILDGWPVGHAGVEAGFFDHAYFARRFRTEFAHRPSLLSMFNSLSSD